MRIGIEACTWANRRGYGRFLRGLVGALVRNHPEHEFTLVLDDATAAGGGFPEGARLCVVTTSTQQIRAASADGSRRIGDMWRLGRAVAREDFDVFLFPTRYSYYPVFARTPTVVAFHDATAEHHPRLLFPSARARLFWRLKTRLALLQADRLVTVSADAQAQIAAAFGIPVGKIAVVSEGPDPIFRVIDPADLAGDGVRATYQLPPATPLLLYVGGISPHKNLQGLLRALALLDGSWHAVLVGDIESDSFWGCHQELVALRAELGIEDRVSFPGYVPDVDLVRLYNQASALVLPSLSEGFGLPVIEAMACGLPVLASARGSLPEVIGNAGVLFDPTDPGAMAAAIRTVLADPVRRAELRRRGLDRAAEFSWERGAERMLAILLDAARGGS